MPAFMMIFTTFLLINNCITHFLRFTTTLRAAEQRCSQFSGIAQGCYWEWATIIFTFLLLASFTCAHTTNQAPPSHGYPAAAGPFLRFDSHLHFCSIRIPIVLVKHGWRQLIRASRAIEEGRLYGGLSGSAVMRHIHLRSHL